MFEVEYFSQEISFTLANESLISSWLIKIAEGENQEFESLTYIFCSDDYLLEINRNHLAHDYYTDIITFDLSEHTDIIVGEIYISIDRVEENAKTYASSFDDELHRVMAHGLLHLLGYGDKSQSEQEEMRRKEDTCISLLSK